MLRCKFERLRRGWTQEDVTRLTGIAQTDVSAIERGRINPTPAELDALARVYEVPAEDVLTRVDRPEMVAPSKEVAAS